nr:PREDICTED: uncharacterized protein LOC100878097 isoform X1 [Megachile rotundata]
MLKSYCRKIFVSVSHPHFRRLCNTQTCKSQYLAHAPITQKLICQRKFNKKDYRLLSSCKASDQFCIDKPMKWPSGNLAKYKFHEDTENILNEQINIELKACYHYLSMTALELETEVAEKLVAVNTVAEKHGDLNASDFIITGFMEDQMKSVNEMGRFVAVLSGIGDQALARFIFDKDLLKNYVVPKFNVIRTKLHVMKTNGAAVSM